jgi:hypothetical protein
MGTQSLWYNGSVIRSPDHTDRRCNKYNATATTTTRPSRCKYAIDGTPLFGSIIKNTDGREMAGKLNDIQVSIVNWIIRNGKAYPNAKGKEDYIPYLDTKLPFRYSSYPGSSKTEKNEFYDGPKFANVFVHAPEKIWKHLDPSASPLPREALPGDINDIGTVGFIVASLANKFKERSCVDTAEWRLKNKKTVGWSALGRKAPWNPEMCLKEKARFFYATLTLIYGTNRKICKHNLLLIDIQSKYAYRIDPRPGPGPGPGSGSGTAKEDKQLNVFMANLIRGIPKKYGNYKYMSLPDIFPTCPLVAKSILNTFHAKDHEFIKTKGGCGVLSYLFLESLIAADGQPNVAVIGDQVLHTLTRTHDPIFKNHVTRLLTYHHAAQKSAAALVAHVKLNTTRVDHDTGIDTIIRQWNSVTRPVSRSRGPGSPTRRFHGPTAS